MKGADLHSVIMRVAMRQFPDQPTSSTPATCPTADRLEPATLDTLSFAPRLIIWAARLWWQDKGDEAGSRQMIAQAFTLARSHGAETAFDELMLMALHGACRHLDFDTHPRNLASDELALLRVLAAFQDDAVIGGEQALEAWLPPATARLAVDSALTLARQMGRAGLYMRPRQQN